MQIRVTYPGSPAFFVYRSGLLVRILQLSSCTHPDYLSGFSNFLRVHIRVTCPGSPTFFIRVTYPGSPVFLVYRSGLLIRVLQLSSCTDSDYLSGFSSFLRVPIRVTYPDSPTFFVYPSGLLFRVINGFLSIYIRVTLSIFIFLSIKFGFRTTYGRDGYVKLTYPTLLAMHT